MRRAGLAVTPVGAGFGGPGAGAGGVVARGVHLSLTKVENAETLTAVCLRPD
jgi:hypothetical protein